VMIDDRIREEQANKERGRRYGARIRVQTDRYCAPPKDSRAASRRPGGSYGYMAHGCGAILGIVRMEHHLFFTESPSRILMTCQDNLVFAPLIPVFNGNEILPTQPHLSVTTKVPLDSASSGSSTQSSPVPALDQRPVSALSTPATQQQNPVVASEPLVAAWDLD